MKAFASGVIVGAMACLAVIRITESRVVESARPALPAVDAPQPLGAPPGQSSVSNSDETASVQTGVQLIRPTLAPDRLSTHEQVTTPSAQVNLASSLSGRRFAVDELSEEEANDLCAYAHQLQFQRERGRKDAEPKDPGWAYSMEQLIRQHIESNVPRNQYSKLQVECRTTFCELEVEGTSKDGQELVRKVGYEIPKQPWSDIVSKGAGSGVRGSNVEIWYVDFEFYRPQGESERRMWQSLRDDERR